MKFRRDKDIKKFIGISLCIILAGIVIFLFIGSVSVFVFILILGGLIGVVTGLSVAAKPKCDLIKDERSVRVKEKAGYTAFMTMLLILAIIPLFRMLKLSPVLTPSRELADGVQNMWLIGIWIFIILKWHYNKTGDLE